MATASCLCGAVRMAVQGDPKRVGLCHCLTCRKETGSAFNFFAVFDSDHVAITGETAAWSPPGRQARHFCPACGSSLFGRSPDAPDEVEIYAGAFDAPNLFAPSYESFVPRREHWLGPFGIRQFEGNRPDDFQA